MSIELSIGQVGTGGPAHETKGIRSVYNRAEYAARRRGILQRWADVIDSQIEKGRKVIIGRFGEEYRAG